MHCNHARLNYLTEKETIIDFCHAYHFPKQILKQTRWSNDKSQYFAQPCPIIVNYFFYYFVVIYESTDYMIGFIFLACFFWKTTCDYLHVKV